MTYFSLPLSFMHPSSIVMHPPKSLALSGLALYNIENEATEAEAYAGTAEAKSSAAYVVMQSAGHKEMLSRVELYSRPVAATLHMHSDFGTAGRFCYRLLDERGSLVLEQNAWIADGIGEHDIEMSGLTPGRYSLLVSWTDEDEESTVMYQIEKLQ
jgi:hypothetical protein